MRDVIVIGAGAGGPVVAKELSARGLDVLLLEGGPRNAHPSQEWAHLENEANNPVTGYFRVGPSDRSRSPWLRETPQYEFLLQTAGVGGTTVHYFGNAPRAYPGVFRGYKGADRANYDRAFEFPFAYCDLIPYYEWAEATVPVLMAPVGTKEDIWLRGAAALGLPFNRTRDVKGASHRPQPNAILHPKGTAGQSAIPADIRYPQARGCTFCGHCYQGCIEPRGAPRNLTAKRSTDNSYVPMALTADAWHKGGRPATLMADSFVTNVRLNEKGEATGVDWRDTRSGDTHSEDAKVIVMAGGCVENPRLWLKSGLPNPNDWVGRGATDHQNDIIVGLFPFYTGHSKGPGSAARADFPGYGCIEMFNGGPMVQTEILTFSDAGMYGMYDNNSPFGPEGADTYGRLMGNDLREYLEHGVDRMMNVFTLADDDVEARNRVTLSDDLPPDEHGKIPRYRTFHRDRSARTKRNRIYLVRKAVELLRKAGATKVHRPAIPPVYIQSTMRMGGDPSNSVVDEWQEARFVKRLFVTDVSSIPNSLGGPNPTLTTQALATRASERIFSKYFGGDPWVKHESPTPSTDRRVTAAVVKRGL
jgi:choline dehydrogenase-like flavoprotein